MLKPKTERKVIYSNAGSLFNTYNTRMNNNNNNNKKPVSNWFLLFEAKNKKIIIIKQSTFLINYSFISVFNSKLNTKPEFTQLVWSFCTYCFSLKN